MPEYTGREPETVAPGETVLIDNRCESPVEIAAGADAGHAVGRRQRCRMKESS